MERFNLNFIAISFQLFMFTLLTNNLAVFSTELMSNPLQSVVCSLVNCGQGTCKASNASLLGFDCECNSGWKKPQLGPFSFPSCVIPNCTVDLNCGNAAVPPLFPPSAPFTFPSLNFSNPCSLVWCGDGSCVPNGTAYSCQCHQGSTNLLNSTGLACFKQCYLGADCRALEFGPRATPPSPVLQNIGSSSVPNCSKNLIHSLAITLLLLAAEQRQRRRP